MVELLKVTIKPTRIEDAEFDFIIPKMVYEATKDIIVKKGTVVKLKEDSTTHGRRI